MNNLDQILRQLIDEACNHPPLSLERRQKLSQIHLLVMKSRKLWKEYTPYYNDALQEMWEYCCGHPEQYDPTIKGVITWLDDELKKRLRRFRDAGYRQQKRQITGLSTDEGKTLDPVDSVAAAPDLQPVMKIWQKTLDWVKKDPDGVLRQTCFRKRPEINAQVLIERRLPPDQPWKTIAAEFQLTPPEAKDLPKFYNRKCLPLLRKFGVCEGYIEEESKNCRSKSSTKPQPRKKP